MEINDSKGSQKNYEVLYRDISNKFWELKNQEKTTEEKKYEELIMDLQEMIKENSSKAMEIDNQIDELTPDIRDYSEIEVQYKEMLRVYKNLKELRDSVIKQ